MSPEPDRPRLGDDGFEYGSSERPQTDDAQQRDRAAAEQQRHEREAPIDPDPSRDPDDSHATTAPIEGEPARTE